mmetsp:Transcript_14642/g.21617  ORF Transcript_14642/g.21617 Transcript_14642/m.21617 type:complete len:81 (-) Transcript_14642:661-903(-)
MVDGRADSVGLDEIVGALLGWFVKFGARLIVGEIVGTSVGDEDGVLVGLKLGTTVGLLVGDSLGRPSSPAHASLLKQAKI